MPPAVYVKNLSKSYRVGVKDPGPLGTLKHFLRRKIRTVTAVQNVTFSIEPGEVVGFLGPNGAGKTTTLKMLTGLIHPSSGDVRVAGHVPFAREHSFLKAITLVMGQKQQLLWDIAAMDSLRVNGAIYGLNDQELHRRIAELAEMLDLRDQLTAPVRKLSLGERMKCELLAALLHQPQILFLDEPTLGLDFNAQNAIRTFLRAYNEQHRATILLTSHYMADITALCQRVLLIHQGRLMFDGSLNTLVKRAAARRVVKVDVGSPVNVDALDTLGCPYEIEGLTIKLFVVREKLPLIVSEVLTRFHVEDLSINDPPIEDLIAKAFREGVSS